jgi:hypothetical protein
VLALTRIGQPAEKGFPRTLSKRGWSDRVINLIQVFAEPVIKFRERPGRESLGIHGLGDLPDVSHNLGVSPQVMHELGVVLTQKSVRPRTQTVALPWVLPFLVHW